jgi:PleD family two-component response regulator
MIYVNILIINRDKLDIQKTKSLLNNNKNIKIFQAQNIRDSLLIVIKNSIDIIICDFQMFHLGNLEIIKILEKNSINKNISFFINTILEIKEINNKIFKTKNSKLRCCS